MEYAINKVTGRLELATQASGSSLYVCPVCKATVNHRSGTLRKPHFAHWPGWGSPECENFVPGQQGQHAQGQASASATKRKMELRLVIPRGADSAGWSVELVLPPCRECRAKLALDVGGRIQEIDMRGMSKGRRVTTELSAAPYRIVFFDGKPDPLFVAGVERECPGLPSFGAAAFTASGRGDLKGFPRTKELRGSETFALLWSKPAEPGFPDELVVDKLRGRQGWSLALVTIPNHPSPECTAWLQSFTGLSIAPPAPSIILIWPFLTRNFSVNAVECVKSSTALLSAEMMPVGQQAPGPMMQVQSVSGRLSSVGVERSPAFFSLKLGDTDHFRVEEANTPDIVQFFSFSLCPECPQGHPTVELAFTTLEGVRRVVPLNQHRCAKVATAARARGMGPEYLSMPPGAKGVLRVDGPAGRSETELFSGGDAPPHSRHMRLPPPDVLTKLTSALADPACHVEIEFDGFGRLHLAGSSACSTAGSAQRELGPALRSRLLSFIFQLRLAAPTTMHVDDVALVGALAVARPEPPLIPHYRSLVKEVLSCGFELKRLGEGASP